MPDETSEHADPEYTADGVPTFDAVREKIETRYGAAQGATVDEQFEARQRAAAERLEQIRASMRENKP